METRSLRRTGRHLPVASTYRDTLGDLLRRVHPELNVDRQLEFKNVFGAVAGYASGRIFITCGKFGVALRLPPDTLESLRQEADVKPLRYFPKGHIKKQYAVLPERIIQDQSRFKSLIDDSVEYALRIGA